MSDTAQQAWRRWWDEEGSAERPLPNEDTEQFARRITEIAWRNGAYVRADEIERLRAELAAMKAQRDEARREVCEIMHYTGYLRGDYANHRKWDCYNDGKHHPFSKEIKQNFNAWMDGQYES